MPPAILLFGSLQNKEAASAVGPFSQYSWVQFLPSVWAPSAGGREQRPVVKISGSPGSCVHRRGVRGPSLKWPAEPGVGCGHPGGSIPAGLRAQVHSWEWAGGRWRTEQTLVSSPCRGMGSAP